MSNWEAPELIDWEENEASNRQDSCYPLFLCVPRICRPAWCYPDNCAPVIFK